jgi:hypothetical protein
MRFAAQASVLCDAPAEQGIIGGEAKERWGNAGADLLTVGGDVAAESGEEGN